jgi:hypothetical protein
MDKVTDFRPISGQQSLRSPLCGARPQQNTIGERKHSVQVIERMLGQAGTAVSFEVAFSLRVSTSQTGPFIFVVLVRCKDIILTHSISVAFPR